jgi:HEAT repeat protein
LAGLGARQLPQLVKAVLEILDNSDDGNLRVGAAELLGSITPTGMKDQVIATLEEYADDTFVRDYAYAGAQGDEDDMRSVGECAKASISELRSRNRR